MATDYDTLLKECDVKTYAASRGSGGQNVNKRDTAVRLYHRPTCLKAKSFSHRTQLANKREALKRLARKIGMANEVKEERKETKPSKAAKQRRLDNKRKRAEKKARRSWKPEQ